VKTPDRTYLIHAEEEEDMKNWMRSIESVAELHKTKDKYEGRYVTKWPHSDHLIIQNRFDLSSIF
jgi:hypothetical protein